MHSQLFAASAYFETAAGWIGHFSASEFFGIVGCTFIIVAIMYREVGENR